MTGEMNIGALFRDLTVTVQEDTFVFVTLPSRQVPDGLSPRMVFEEGEGTTLILTTTEAQTAGLDGEFPSRMLTLEVHSALAAVGFMARIATALAEAGIPCNPVAGFFHDHLFVPLDRVDDAVRVVTELGSSSAIG